MKKTERHGMTESAEYRIWCGVKRRCFNKNDASFRFYGARGITICDRWRDSFVAFYEDMGPRPSSKHSIDRIDSNGNYEPGNCRWATSSEQSRNMRSNRRVAVNGEFVCTVDAAKMLGLQRATITRRLMVGYDERSSTFPGLFRHRSAAAKLTFEDAREIRRLYATGEFSQRQLARQFNVSHFTIGETILGRRWQEEFADAAVPQFKSAEGQ